HKEHIKELYRMDNLDKLSSEQNIKAIDDILEDILFRKQCLLPRLKRVRLLLKDKPNETKLLENNVKQATEMSEIISIVEEELNYLRESLQAIESHIDE